LLRTGAANFSATGLKWQDNDLIVIESAEAAQAFKHAFDARFASGDALVLIGRRDWRLNRRGWARTEPNGLSVSLLIHQEDIYRFPTL
jgi:phosphatidylserine/phosphatidylglycerophosphate/cardiolipin synthase-like enzyme